ncbi:DUF2254 domain-containing protein [Rhizobiaceae bacterium n13]|uniref:DUF2254 domain-containing protein n=1 Tax=Ferirhizobium litorale TaxID=2927786 RepID=A0AAE3QAL1_9HYPH|nr:DUF2254 domain-containing protein [Fererhizobium litorale]MDI7861313.1 DUF2254 domain-containing protein [Fererhizobium litorale]MDI7921460.1 DUF2254 domain-containing protein [Fererhizobium litorale]
MTITRRWWLIAQQTRRLWFKATLYCAVAIATALVAILLGPYIPEGLSRRVGSDAVDAILTIIASSMLAVTTFSLSTLVSATSTAASTATPRATSLLLQDATAQRALSTFLGAFLFSLVGLIGLKSGLYTDGGRLVLFIATLVVVALIVGTLLRWIDHLAGLGRMGETISRVEKAATSAMAAYRHLPYLGAEPYEHLPDAAIAVGNGRIGYIQHLDVSALSDVAERIEGRIYVARRPGGYCDPSNPIAHVVLDDPQATLEADALDDIRDAFGVADRRSYEQDPRFGLIALSEIGSRALSPGINDPGTAIDVLAAIVRVFATEPEGGEEDGEPPRYPRVHLPPLAADDLIDAAFMPISRDGAGMIEVCIRLQKALSAVAHMADGDCARAARNYRDIARARALETLSFEVDRERLMAHAPA